MAGLLVDERHQHGHLTDSEKEGSDSLEQHSRHDDDEEEIPAKDASHGAGSVDAEKPGVTLSGPPGPGPVPNGGLQAWLQVLGSFMLFFNTWGVLNTFGVYQTYYESGELYTEVSSNISWIGSIQSFMVLLVGAFIGPIYDRGYLRTLLVTGTFLIVFGHMMLSLCTTYWQCLLAQGFTVGIGGGFLYIPSLAILPGYFSTRIGLAIGVAASGSSLGGIIYPIMFYKLIGQVGFPWTVRILGFTALATLLIPILIMKMRCKPAQIRSLIDKTAFTDGPYLLFISGCLVGFIGMYTGFFYLSYYGKATGYTSASLSFYLVAIQNSGSVLGRTLPNILSDRIGPQNVIIPGAFGVSIALFCVLAVSNAGGLIAIAVFFGFFSGVFIALPPVIFVALTQDKRKIGTRIGMAYSIIGLGVLAGGPGAGAILGNNEADLEWTGTWLYAGLTPLVGACIFLAVRFWTGGSKLMVKI
ncbi:unnamed protein product [Zymoseptoria tritici ST99CH_3D1]|nr:unnamed protein product [Zymoseptoria tritici ST99CH_3D1]